MSLTKEFLKTIARETRAKFFVETGTAKGETSNVAKDIYQVHTIEIDEKLAIDCKKRFKPFPNITVYHGDSVQMLPLIVRKISAPAVFWLDGHNSPGMMEGKVNTPLLQELAIIRKAKLNDAVLLIDDIRCSLWQHNDWNGLVNKFGPAIRNLHDSVGNGWPSLSEIVSAVKAINPHYTIGLMGDILIAFDKRTGMYLSPTLNACSELLFNAAKLSQSKILHYEKIIAKADERAFKAIQEQAHILSIHEHPCYHPHFHFWLGIMLLHRKRFELSEQHLLQAKNSGFNVKRVDFYLAKVKARKAI